MELLIKRRPVGALQQKERTFVRMNPLACQRAAARLFVKIQWWQGI
jgi:hypothetical protein